MRIPDVDENLVGKVGVCSVGRVAIITGKTEFAPEGKTEPIACWAGIGFDGKGTWASTKPAIVAESGEEFHDRLKNRFGGKMSFNG